MFFLFLSSLLVFNVIQDDLSNSKILIRRNNFSVSQWSQVSETSPSENPLSPFRNEDTLVLDDGSEFNYFFGQKYDAQRFTPGVPCTLESVIMKLGISGIPSSLFVWNDSSGVPQSSVNLIPPIYFMSSSPGWQRVDLTTPIVINDDFWLGLYDITYSILHSDNTPNCHNRYATSYDKEYWFVDDYHYFGEFLIRPIGKLTGPRHDVSCTTIFSKKGFFLQNPAYDTVGIVVKNFGNVTESNVPVYLRVKDTLGLVVFFDVKYIDSLKHNEIDTVFIPWSYNKDGDYIIEGYPWLSNDCVRDNDKQEIASYIRTYPSELYYANVKYEMSSTKYDSIANKFFPPYYPCKIESVKFCYGAWSVGTTFTYGIAAIILDDDAPGGFPGTEIAKDSILGLTPVFIDTLSVDFSQQNVVFDTGGFFVQWTDIPDSTTPYKGVQVYTDWATPPCAKMAWIKDNGVWEHWWENTDAMIWVSVDYPSAVSEERKGDKFHNVLSINPSITKGRFKCYFSTSKDARIEISLYSKDGRRIKTLFSNYVKKGLHYFYPDITNFPQGVYFIRMRGDGFAEKKKLILIK